MRHAVLLATLPVLLDCASATGRPAPGPTVIGVRPVATAAPAPTTVTPVAKCSIEGAGEPIDRLFFHTEEELVLFGARADAEPLVRIEGNGRYTLHGQWTELGAPDGDGRARLVLERAGVFRLSGFSLLRATRFRLRRRTALVPDHVWLEPDYLLQVGAASGDRARAVARLPFDAPKELPLEVPCSDLAYDDQRELVRDPETKAARAHVDRVALHGEPGGPLVFEAGPLLFFVTIDETRDGFMHIHGERHGVRIAGWTPENLVSQAPQGAGAPGGGRSAHGTKAKGKAARVTRATSLIAERAGHASTIGQLEAGAAVRILGAGTGGHVPIALEAAEVRAVQDVTLRIAEADLEPI